MRNGEGEHRILALVRAVAYLERTEGEGRDRGFATRFDLARSDPTGV